MAKAVGTRSRNVAMATNFICKIGVLAEIPSFVALALRNGLKMSEHLI